MSNTLSANQAALIASEVIADDVIKAHLPSIRFLNLVHHKSMDGMGSNKLRIPVYSDLGAASGGTEGVDATPSVTLGMGTSVEVTPSEGVLEMALISDDTVMRRLGGSPFRTVKQAFFSGDDGAISALLRPDIERMIPMGLQKIEADGLELLKGVSNTVGPAAGNSLRILDMLTAVYQMKTQQPLRPRSEWVYLLAPVQTHHLNLEALSASGGVSGTLWGTSSADYNIANNNAEAEPGWIGSFLQYNTYEIDDELVPLDSAGDAVGSFFCRGRPNVAPDSPALGGRPGAFAYVERHFLNISFEGDVSYRAAEVVMNARYAWAELADLNAVGIVSKASV